MTKITVIGAGSYSFGLRIMKDLASMSLQDNSPLKESEVVLMDIDSVRLDYMMQIYKKMQELYPNIPLKVTATTDLRQAVTDTSYVIVAIHPGGRKAIVSDNEIPKKYGDKAGRPLMPCKGDTLSAGGIMRGCRSIPAMLEIVDAMAEKAHKDALLMNYSNPIAMIVWAMNEHIERNNYDVNVVGLCHGVHETAILFRVWCGALPSEFAYTCAGINHMSWYVDMRMKDFETGKWIDAYPVLKNNLKESPPSGDFHPETFRREVMDQIGYFCTEDSSSLSEFVPWPVRTRQELFDKYRFASEGPNMKKLAGAKKWNADIDKKHFENILSKPRNYRVPDKPSFEYVSWIINACETPPFDDAYPKTYYFYGNVKNENIITNLPYGCCVEVPCIAVGRGWSQQGPIVSTFQGDLPPQCAALCRTNINVQELVVKACLEGDPEYVGQAMILDPHICQVLEPSEARAMANEMLEDQRKWLPQFNM